MKDIRYFLGWLLIILPLHGIEQFLTGFDELYELQGQVGTVLDLFPDRDSGTVFMVFAVVMLVMTFMYCVLRGGRSRLVGFAFFGVCGLVESHHVIKTVVHLDYFPGAVTAIPFAIVGGLLLRAVVREWRALPAIGRLEACSP
jgi:hypothetical protein